MRPLQTEIGVGEKKMECTCMIGIKETEIRKWDTCVIEREGIVSAPQNYEEGCLD